MVENFSRRAGFVGRWRFPGHAPTPAIINLRGPRIRVSGEVLNIFEGHVLIEGIGHDRDPEAVRGEELRQARIRETPLQQFTTQYPALPNWSILKSRSAPQYSWSRAACES
jgi:hypothetical protein